jgi:hypothetical protein
LTLGSPGLDGEETGDLLVGVPFHIVQHEHLATAMGELFDGTLEIDPLLGS